MRSDPFCSTLTRSEHGTITFLSQQFFAKTTTTKVSEGYSDVAVMMLPLRNGELSMRSIASILAFIAILSAKPAHTSRGPFRQRESLRKPKPGTHHIKDTDRGPPWTI